MKKTSFIIPTLALLLAACGGSTQQNNGGTTSDGADGSPSVSKSDVDGANTVPTAYQIFKIIDPKNASIKLDNGTDTTSKDKFTYSKFCEDYYEGELVQCLDNKDGGRLAIYQKWFDGAVDGYYTQDLKLYLYQNGKLTERNDLLPQVTVDDFVAVDNVSLYNASADVKARFSTPNVNKEYDNPDESPSLLRYYSYVYHDNISLYFKWDGSKFVRTDSDRQISQFNMVTTAGVGKIFLGDNPPESLVGFQKSKEGKNVVFSRDGKKHFKLALTDDGKIDTIFILSDRYTHCIDCDGPTNDHFGIGFRDISYGIFNEYFTFKDGVWVRVIDEANDYNIKDMFGEQSNNRADYPHNGVIEFYTSKNAITNINPEPGKQVGWRDEPKYDENARVSIIKIYRQQATGGKGGKIAEEVFKKMYPDIKSFECYDESPMKCVGYPANDCEGCMSDEEIACYPLKDGGYLVVNSSAFGGPGCATEYSFRTCKYVNGTIQDFDIELPMPKLEDLLKPDMVDSYKTQIAKFREMFDENPMGFVCYEFMPPNVITVRLHPFDCDAAYFDMDKVMLDPYNDDKVPEYKWNGEKFVKE